MSETREESGKIVDISDGTATLEVQMLPGEECAKCGACRLVGGGRMQMRVATPEAAEVGDTVRLSISNTSPVAASIIGFAALPIALMVGFALGKAIAPDWAWLFGLAALLAAAGGAYLYDRHLRASGKARVEVVEVAAKSEAERGGHGPSCCHTARGGAAQTEGDGRNQDD